MQSVAVSDQAMLAEGLQWLLMAANSGDFKAQGILVELYVVKQGPNADPIDGAKWAHLYLTNPSRLTIGAPVFIAHVIDNLQSQITTNEWLLGKERARLWTPRFDAP